MWQVLANGKPVSGARVRLSNIDVGISDIDYEKSDDNGHVEFDVPAGSWALHTSVSRPERVELGHEIADYRTVFTSVTFTTSKTSVGD